jgi:hypothetical protein
VREKGLAQWRFEQAQLIIENSAAMPQKDRENTSTIFFKKKTDDIDADIIRNVFNMEAAVATLEQKIGSVQEAQKAIMDTLQEVLEAMPSASSDPLQHQ